MSRTPGTVAAAALSAVLLLAGCTGGDDAATGPSSEDAGVTATAPAPDTASPEASAPEAASPETTGPQADDEASGPETSDEATDAGATSEAVTALDAIELALAEVPGTVVELDLDTERGELVWEVEVLAADGAGIEVTLSATSGQVLGQEPTNLDSEQRTAPQVSASDAIEIALAAAPGEVHELDLDTEGGRVVWEVEIRDGAGEVEVVVDAATGEVITQYRSD